MSIVRALIVVSCLHALLTPSFGQSPPEKVRIASYNIEHFGGKPNGPDRIGRLTAVIKSLDADVIGLQEIKDRAALRQLFPADKWQILIDNDSQDSQDLAIAVRLPFTIEGRNDSDIDATDDDFLYPIDSPTAEPFPNNRDVLFARIAIPGTDTTFVMMVHHAKARVGGRQNTDPRRKLAAELIVDAIQSRLDGEHVVLVGDLNDNPDDDSTNILETGDPNAPADPDDVSDDAFLVNLTQPLVALDHVSWGLHEDSPVLRNGKRNTRVAGSRSQNNATRGTRGSSAPILFDQILITRSAFERFTVQMVMVHDDPIAQKGRKLGQQSAAINYASDHTPVVAQFSPKKPVGTPTIPTPTDGGTAAPVDTPPHAPVDSAPLAKVRIAQLLPNPAGEDAGNETVTLKNFGADDVDVTGWRLIDRSGNELELVGVIGHEESMLTRLKAGQVPLNNDGDELRLFSEDDVVRYAGSEAKAGESVRFAN